MNANGERSDLAGGDVDICARIRRARRVGKTRCGVVEGRMDLAEVARAFGLADDGAIYRSIDSVEANVIATRVLHADLAYSSEIMSMADATGLWSQFAALFDGQNVEFVTNVGAEFGSWIAATATAYTFAPATAATFDMGILIIGATKAGCLWVEDED